MPLEVVPSPQSMVAVWVSAVPASVNGRLNSSDCPRTAAATPASVPTAGAAFDTLAKKLSLTVVTPSVRVRVTV